MEQDAHHQTTLARTRWNWRKWLILAIILFILYHLIRGYMLSFYVVAGISMEPHFQHGDRVVVNQLIYQFRMPKRGEVIVFDAPNGQKNLIKRVIALPGDSIMVKGDDVWISGQRVREPYIANEIRLAHQRGTLYNKFNNYRITTEGIVPAIVPDDTLFVMGDNRPYSRDSRSRDVGFIPIEDVLGRAEFVWWPAGQAHKVDHPEPEVGA
ncbi:signal peptidase I [Marinicrinis sediminis]|uniref:Signal peptidase I n=1 Tax=Marinicrinis sediminis TaxID=1652465 RepID=A0ABW5R6C1_9BACL